MTAVVFIVLTLSGCLLTRVSTFKTQLCDYPNNFDLRIDEVVQVSMHNPVLLDTDVVFIAGAEPFEQNKADDTLEMHYVIEKQQIHTDPSSDIPIHLRFRRLDGKYRLEKGQVNKDLRALLNPAIVEYYLSNSCAIQPNLWRRSVEIDLSGLDKSKLPTRNNILEALGPPLTTSSDSHIVYEFRLKGADPDTSTSRTAIWFDPTDDQVLRVSTRYMYYEVEADFVAAKAVMKITL